MELWVGHLPYESQMGLIPVPHTILEHDLGVLLRATDPEHKHVTPKHPQK